MSNCFIFNEVNRMLSEQERYDALYHAALTEVEMDFLATHEAQEVLTNYVLNLPNKTGLVTDFWKTADKLARNDIGADELDISMLLAIVLFRGPAYKLALQEICSRVFKAAYEHGYIDRMVQEKM